MALNAIHFFGPTQKNKTGTKNFVTCKRTRHESQIREQMLVPDLYVFTLKFQPIQTRQKHEKKNFPPPIFFFTFILCNFSVRTLRCFQKKKKFGHEKVQKRAPKVAHNQPNPFFFHTPAQN